MDVILGILPFAEHLLSRGTEVCIFVYWMRVMYECSCNPFETFKEYLLMLLMQNLKVLLCANNRPVLNDVTHAELVLIVQRAAKISPIIDNAMKSGRLLCLNSGTYFQNDVSDRYQFIIQMYFVVIYNSCSCHFIGQSSACLDLARLNWSLVEQMIQRKVDLLVLEGMGRAIHTNFYAHFKCECLKVTLSLLIKSNLECPLLSS